MYEDYKWVIQGSQIKYLAQRVQVPNMFEVSGPKGHTFNGFWKQRPQIYGTPYLLPAAALKDKAAPNYMLNTLWFELWGGSEP